MGSRWEEQTPAAALSGDGHEVIKGDTIETMSTGSVALSNELGKGVWPTSRFR